MTRPDASTSVCWTPLSTAPEPEAVRVLDAFHTVRLGTGTQVVDEVRRRVQQDTLGLWFGFCCGWAGFGTGLIDGGWGAPDQVAPLLAVTGAAVVDAFGLEEGNVVVRFESAREHRMFWG